MHRAHARAGKPISEPASVGYQSKRGRAVSYYEGDPFSNHELNEVKCAECGEYFDDQEREGNICPPCIEKEGEAMKEYGYYVEGDGLICLQCGGNPLYDGVLTRAEAEGYPNGFTCADCGVVVEGKSK